MTDLFHKILVYLYNSNGLNIELSINDFLRQELAEKSYDNETLMKVKKVLESLNTSKYATMQSIPFLGMYNRGKSKSNNNNLDDHDLYVKLELAGHNYIAEKITKLRQEELLFKQTEIAEKSGQSVIDANEFNVKTIKKNGKLFWLTFIVALIGAAGTIAGVILSYQQQKLQQGQLVQDSTLSLIKNKTIQIEHTLFLQRKTIDSLKNILNEKK